MLEKEQLSYEEMERLIGAPPYGAKSKISPTDWDAFQEEDAAEVKSPRDLPTSEGVPLVDSPPSAGKEENVKS